jgi:class 3 adenylate cyclase
MAMAVEPLIFLAEVFGFSVALCALHALRSRLGLAPLYLAVAFFQVMIFVADKGATPISVSLFWGPPAFIGYATFLPLLLSALVLVYVLEGTRAARRLVAAIGLVHVLHAAADVLISYHAHHPPPGQPWLGDSVLVEYSLWVRAASYAAFVVDAVVILVSYQFLVNRLGRLRLPFLIPIFVALVAAMLTDAVVFSTLYGLWAKLGTMQVVEKLQVAAVAAIPVAIYIQLQLRQQSESVRRGVIERSAFEVLSLRERVLQAEKQLRQARQRYQAVKEGFSRYLSPELVEAMLADPSRMELGGEERDVTVLFADVADYTRLSERLEPGEVIQILNRYYDTVGREILDRGGLIVAIEGDAVMAAFGAPLDAPDHPARAAHTALAMLEAVDRLNDRWRADGTLDRWCELGLEPLAIRIGLHSGAVVAGNVGSASRIEYTLIGDTVNIASRIEGLNKRFETQVLLTADTARRLEDPELERALGDLGVHQVRGRQEPVHVYTLRRPEAPPEEC